MSLGDSLGGNASGEVGAALSVGVAAAQGGMNPLSDLAAVTSVVGLGMSIFGGVSAADDAKKAANIQSTIAGDEGQLEEQRHQAMLLSASRQQVEILRNNQRARSTAMNNAVNQGAQFGSGIQGGLGQIQDQSLFNLAGVNQNLEIGNKMFDINQQITQQKQQLAQVQGQSATDQGIASLGGAITKAGPTIGALGQSGYSQLSDSLSLFRGGSLSGGRGTT